MVKAIIDVSRETNRVLNIIKAKAELKTKSQAIDWLASEYEKVRGEKVQVAKRETPHITHFRRLYG